MGVPEASCVVHRVTIAGLGNDSHVGLQVVSGPTLVDGTDVMLVATEAAKGDHTKGCHPYTRPQMVTRPSTTLDAKLSGGGRPPSISATSMEAAIPQASQACR